MSKAQDKTKEYIVIKNSRKLLKDENYLEAQKILNCIPNKSPAVFYHLGTACKKLGQVNYDNKSLEHYNNALDSYESITKTNISHDPNVYFQQGVVLCRLAELYKDNAQYKDHTKGIEYYKKAEEVFNKAIELYSASKNDDPDTFNNIGLVEYSIAQQVKHDEKQNYYLNSIGHYNTAISYNRDSAIPYYNLGLVLYSLANEVFDIESLNLISLSNGQKLNNKNDILKEAEQCYRRAITHYNELNDSKEKDTKADFYFNLGIVLLNLSDNEPNLDNKTILIKDAQHSFKEAISEINKITIFDARFRFENVLQNKPNHEVTNLYEELKARFDDLIQQPQNELVRNLYINIKNKIDELLKVEGIDDIKNAYQAMNGQFKIVNKFYLKLVDIHKFIAKTFYILGDIAKSDENKKFNYENAVQAYSEAISINRANINYVEVDKALQICNDELTYFNLANLYRSLASIEQESIKADDYYEKALACCDTAKEIEPEYGNAYILKGYVIYDKAKKCTDKYLKKSLLDLALDDCYGEVYSPMAFLGQGNVLFLQEKWYEARTAYNHALSLAEEGCAAIYYLNRARVLYKIDQYKDALVDLEKAFELMKNGKLTNNLSQEQLGLISGEILDKFTHAIEKCINKLKKDQPVQSFANEANFNLKNTNLEMINTVVELLNSAKGLQSETKELQGIFNVPDARSTSCCIVFPVIIHYDNPLFNDNLLFNFANKYGINAVHKLLDATKPLSYDFLTEYLANDSSSEHLYSLIGDSVENS